MKTTLCFLIAFLFTSLSFSQSVLSNSYSGGDIPTASFAYDNSCSGPAQIVFVLPSGGLYEVTGFDVAYIFQSVAPESPSTQNSRLTCLTTGISESIFTSMNTTAGAFEAYSRSEVDIANGYYNGGDSIIFELEVWRDSAGSCGIDQQFIFEGTWKIDLKIGAEMPAERVGIKTTTPLQALHVDGKIQVGNDVSPPQDGTIMFHEDSFYGYANGEWQRFSQNKVILGPSANVVDGSFNYAGLNGIEAGNQMCRDAYPDEPTARMYFSDDINNALSYGNVEGIVEYQPYWTLVPTFTSVNVNSSQYDNCYQFNTNNAGLATGTTVTFYLDDFIPGSFDSGSWVDYRRAISCSTLYTIICGK